MSAASHIRRLMGRIVPLTLCLERRSTREKTNGRKKETSCLVVHIYNTTLGTRNSEDKWEPRTIHC